MSSTQAHAVQSPILCALLLLMALSTCAAGGSGDGLSLARVFPVFESEGSHRVARRELECHPCSKVWKPGDDPQAYLYDPGAAVAMTAEVIDGIELMHPDEDGKYVVMAMLTPKGVEFISEQARRRFDEAAFFLGDELVDVVPLRVVGTRLLLAVRSSEADAKSLASQIRGGLGRSEHHR